MNATVRATLALAACLGLASCERERHDMYRQARFDADERTSLFADGRATRPPPPGTVPVDAVTLAVTSSGRAGDRQRTGRGRAVGPTPGAPALAQLERGRERFEIVCVPCHSPIGDGDGMVVRRGFPRPPSYHEERLRAAPDRYFFDVITNGHGVMYSYADRVTPEDRWAIVAYIRALQLSQHAELARLPAPVRAEVATGLAQAPGPQAPASASPMR